MLKIITNIKELDLEQFFSIYKESSFEVGREEYPRYSEHQQLAFAEENLLEYIRNDFFCQADAFSAIWVTDGFYRSALRIEPYRDGVLLHALETAQSDRRKGYAFELVLAVLQYLQAKNCKTVYSHIAKRNKPSLRLHEKCGFSKFSDSAVYLDGTVTQNSCTMICEL